MTTPGIAAARLRREAHSVHHAVCDPMRPQGDPSSCTCKVPVVANALADLLDAFHDALADRRPGGRMDYMAEWRRLESLINGSDGPFAQALEAAFPAEERS